MSWSTPGWALDELNPLKDAEHFKYGLCPQWEDLNRRKKLEELVTLGLVWMMNSVKPAARGLLVGGLLGVLVFSAGGGNPEARGR